ncbi:hypothetical protein TEA_007131 [Camellia sinensis var. sinensis]|uniref:non-specific serine/threonine protein kinase n=1 Tax=Camellia sinensis var. sinensis TaxID=542762 RepID=A0A4S4DM01_CAMSN|nr:hypothetical protein TEA_007131 [Camellia sinensis var. sinensis]
MDNRNRVRRLELRVRPRGPSCGRVQPPGLVTLDGHDDDWKNVAGFEFSLLPALDPHPDHEYKGGKMIVKALHDGKDVYFMLQIDVLSIVYSDLSRNYLSGPLPREWASTKLELINFNSNNLTGELPKEFSNLINLRELSRLSSNNFNGKLPSFQSCKQLGILELEASGFEGPIPSGISLLHNLTEIRITDLNGGASEFPHLENMKASTKLTLRNCNISGPISVYLANLSLTLLDLSFNRLEGHIPDFEGATYLQTIDSSLLSYELVNLALNVQLKWQCATSEIFQIETIVNGEYLSSSQLHVPRAWRSSPHPSIVPLISYVYDTPLLNSVLPLLRKPDAEWTYIFFFFSCILFMSFTAGETIDLIPAATVCFLRLFEDGYSLHINCGGGQTKIGNTMYVADESQGGPTTLQAAGNWGFSSTGHFWDVNANAAYYQTKNVSVLTMNEYQLYTSARLSPLDNRSYQSLGGRIFNVYIQDELVLKDFDIETVAQGVDKAVVLKFNNTVVKNKTMEIRFYWAGKGTRVVPDRGIYGPLISAISIESNSKPHSDQRKKIVIVIGAVTFSLCLVFTILFIFWRRGHSESIASREQELRGLDLQTGLFTFRQIKAATNNFDNNNKIGEGGFGSVYKGVLLDGTVIAVKQLSSKSKQGNREFVNEIGMISGLQHPNLVRLYGYCIEGNQLLLVYEYMENNSLARALFGPQEWQLNLGWPTRLKICIGIARGLAFPLHEESRLKIVHRDIKATNVLLDGDLNPKISDFGLAKLSEDDNTHISTRVAGTIGYMAPEYALWGYLTNKADVYSFGIVALEIAAGKDNMKFRPSDKYVCLLDWVSPCFATKGRLMELVVPKLGPDFDKEEAIKMIKIALLCTNPSPAIRPAMSAVVSMLEGHLDIQDLVMDPSIYGDEYRFRSLKGKYDELQLQSSNEAQTLTDSMVTTEIGSSSTSTNDLYQINCHSV